MRTDDPAAPGEVFTRRAITATIVALTFGFSLGNVTRFSELAIARANGREWRS